MSLVRIPPPRPNIWCIANFPLSEVVLIRGSDGKEHCKTSKRTCRQSEEDTHEDIFGASALALAGRRRCSNESDDNTKTRIFGEREIAAPEEHLILPVLKNLTRRTHRTNTCIWKQYPRKPSFDRDPLVELRRIPENEEGASNANCNKCLKLPSICSQIMSCGHPVEKRRQCCSICHQCPPCVTDAANCRCIKRDRADVYWLGDPKETQCSCRVCGQTCLGRHALELAETRCPAIELPNQLYWLGNPVCGVPSALQRGCGSSLASNESWPFGGFSRQPCRNRGCPEFSRSLQYCSATNSSLNSSRDSAPSRYQNIAEPSTASRYQNTSEPSTASRYQNKTEPSGYQNTAEPSKYQNTAEPSRYQNTAEPFRYQNTSDTKPFRASHDTIKSGSTLSRSSRYQPSHTRTVIPSQTRAVVDTSRTKAVINTSSECDYTQPNCPNENDC